MPRKWFCIFSSRPCGLHRTSKRNLVPAPGDCFAVASKEIKKFRSHFERVRKASQSLLKGSISFAVTSKGFEKLRSHFWRVRKNSGNSSWLTGSIYPGTGWKDPGEILNFVRFGVFWPRSRHRIGKIRAIWDEWDHGTDLEIRIKNPKWDASKSFQPI